MKRILMPLFLFCCMLVSLASSTFALYQTSIDNIVNGDVYAKQFVFAAEGVSSYYDATKLAPTESLVKLFKVSNYVTSGGVDYISEVDMSVDIKVTIAAKTAGYAVVPLTAKIIRIAPEDILFNAEGEVVTTSDHYTYIAGYHSDDSVIAADASFLDSGVGVWQSYSTTNSPITMTKEVASTYYFGIYITWPSTVNDILYQGASYGQSIKVSVVATQIVA